jgi:hypothetical protein
MSTQPKALRLSNDLDDFVCDFPKTAAELRRLHLVNVDLLEALKDIVEFWDSIVPTDAVNQMHINARAAIAKATEGA